MLTKTNPISMELPVRLKPPTWLDYEGRVVWNKKLKRMAALGLLHSVNPKILADFCKTVSLYAKLSRKRKLKFDDHKTLLRYSQIILRCADRLGFTPTSRARLVQRRHVIVAENIKQ